MIWIALSFVIGALTGVGILAFIVAKIIFISNGGRYRG